MSVLGYKYLEMAKKCLEKARNDQIAWKWLERAGNGDANYNDEESKGT